jgi:hypothetical protein
MGLGRERSELIRLFLGVMARDDWIGIEPLSLRSRSFKILISLKIKPKVSFIPAAQSARPSQSSRGDNARGNFNLETGPREKHYYFQTNPISP